MIPQKYEESKHGTKWETELDWARLNPKPPTKTNIKPGGKDLKIAGFDFKSLFEGKTAIQTRSIPNKTGTIVG
jgi:hypothetical protein